MHRHVFQLSLTATLLFAGAESLDAGNILDRPIPAGWTTEDTRGAELPADDSWWRLFGDSTLDSLLQLAQNNNYNLEIAARRLDQANQAVRSASAAYYPTVGATAGWQREHAGTTTGGYSLGLRASWEIDVFGKTYSRVKSQRFSRDASAAQYAQTMLTMCASLATAYFDLRTAQAQLQVAEAHTQGQDTIVSKTVARFEAGLTSKLDVTQARTVLYSTQASIPALRTQIEGDKQAIAILCGIYADEIAPMLQHNEGIQPDYRRIVGIGVPAELLRRRPDVVAAEADVSAAAASLGVARK
ncbi:MAG: TolC family protein, partial [Muribaculaceae bacterium]|nr:TolC family protein [Muribaculaceae bacterium]